MNLILKSFIIATFFIVVNSISYKLLVKNRTLMKTLFVFLLTMAETCVCTYIDVSLVYQNTVSLCGILSIMTISDIESMEVPEWTLIALPICSILNFGLLCIKTSAFLYGNIIVAAVAFISLSLLGKLYNDMLGGADIFMVASIALVFGLMHTLYMLIIGCAGSIIFMLIYSKIKKTKATGVPLPFLPGLTMGFLFAFFI